MRWECTFTNYFKDSKQRPWIVTTSWAMKQTEMNTALVHTPAYFKSIGLMQIRALTNSFYDFECSVGVN